MLSLFKNDASSARPDGSMEVVRLYWWQHTCKEGQNSSAKVHRSVKAELKAGIDEAKSADDYIFVENFLPGLEVQPIEGR